MTVIIPQVVRLCQDPERKTPELLTTTNEGVTALSHATCRNHRPPWGRFQPLPTVLSYDDFSQGTGGWLELMPNFTKPGFTARESIIDKTRWGPTMLSTATFGYMGTHGAMSGIYSLKLATRPVANRYEEPPAPGSMAHAIKRLSVFRPRGLTQLEMWFAYTPEQDRIGLGEKDIRALRRGVRRAGRVLSLLHRREVPQQRQRRTPAAMATA